MYQKNCWNLILHSKKRLKRPFQEGVMMRNPNLKKWLKRPFQKDKKNINANKGRFTTKFGLKRHGKTFHSSIQRKSNDEKNPKNKI